MTHALLTDLAWLPAPPLDFKARVRELSPETPDLGQRLRQLATHTLDLNQLTRLAKRVRELRTERASLSPLAPLRLGLLSNATTQLVGPALEASAARHGLDLEVIEAPFDQVMQTALDPGSAFQRARPDVVLLALDLRGVSLVSDPASLDPGHAHDVVLGALDELDTIRSGIRAGCGAPCIVQTLARPPEAEFGHLDLRTAGTRRQLVEAWNRSLCERLHKSGDLVLDVAAIAESVGLAEWHDPVQWHLAKLPFAQRYVPLYADHVARVLAAMRGRSRRCLVLDLDNTLWGGVVADDGLDNLVLGQGDPTGEAFLSVQETALALRARGIVLAVCSKNSDANAILPFREHPDMRLREQHISVFQANFEDKASNLKAIADALDLGVDSLVLLDDNPAERAQVRAALPEVGVPELPPDPAYYARTLLAAGYFETTSFSDEDRERAQMYEANARRVAVRERVADLESYLTSLEMEIDFRPFDEVGRERIAQLVNKSNQFNLTTRRRSPSEIEQLERDRRYATWQIRLRDRFGDNGMISVVVCDTRPTGVARAADAPAWSIDTWLMSCRVLGRRVEEAVLAELVRAAQEQHARRLLGVYVPTERNLLVEDHYSKLGFRELKRDPATGATTWSLDLADYVPIRLPMRVAYAGVPSSELARNVDE